LPDLVKAQILDNLLTENVAVKDIEEKIPFKAEIGDMNRLGEVKIAFTQPVKGIDSEKLPNKQILKVT